jgi:hypothetical protein
MNYSNQLPTKGFWQFGSATCLSCNREIGLTKNGLFRRHVKVLGGNGEICSESGKCAREDSNEPLCPDCNGTGCGSGFVHPETFCDACLGTGQCPTETKVDIK